MSKQTTPKYCQHCGSTLGYSKGRTGFDGDTGEPLYTDEIGGDVSFYFDPFIKIADAWLVVEKLVKFNHISVESYGDSWYVVITEKECSCVKGEHRDDTAPLAICLAALDVMEEK